MNNINSFKFGLRICLFLIIIFKTLPTFVLYITINITIV